MAKKQATSRPTWTPYYQRITRNKKKYIRKQKHPKDYRYDD